MADKHYLLTIKIPISALDDPAARFAAKEELNRLGISAEDYGIAKLQRIEADRTPEKVSL